MTHSNRTVALVVAAGRGERAGGSMPKQFAALAGKAVIAHSVDRLLSHPKIDAVYVVTGHDQMDLMATALSDRAVMPLISGGENRRISVENGLAGIQESGGAKRILIHDAARPLLPAAVIDRLLAALDRGRAAIPVLPVADTLAQVTGADRLGDTISRTSLARVQTPQAFDFETIRLAHASWPVDREATDDAQMVRAAGLSVAIIEGDPLLEKITQAADFAGAEARLSARCSTRVGMGYDVHRLVAGETLWLGGIIIPHDHGLSGHSDADVALHALTDALLGAVAAGDIGQHFPPSDPQWKGASSDRFLCHAASLVAAAQGVIEHVDLTIICEAPKIGPYREAIRQRVAELLQLELRQVSIKATTTERLGFTGRREGIAAQAVATVKCWEAF